MSTPPRTAPLPVHDTVVTYPDGATASTSTVVHVSPLEEDTTTSTARWAVLLDRTCAHPVDTAWPDQPADRGALIVDGRRLPFVDVVTGGIHGDALLRARDLPVRTGTEGWVFVVAHVVEGAPPAVGSVVDVEVDAGYRRSLSVGHTACHLASLALDAALASAWSKPASVDALGHPAFDSLAIETSRIEPGGSVDVYRVGKSLRRKGFAVAALDDVASLTAHVNGILSTWLAAARGDGTGDVRVERDADGLSDRRRWVCELPEGTVTIPCGGTHVSHLDDFTAIEVSLQTTAIDGAVELTMTTRAHDGGARLSA